MTYILPPCGCDCATIKNPCCCSTNGVSSSLSFVSRKTQACTCGMAEFIPSNPPKRYRNIDNQGNIDFIYFTGPFCTGSVGSEMSCSYSGYCHHDRNDCSETQGGTGVCSGSNPFGPNPPDTTGCQGLGTSTCNVTFSQTSSSQSWTGNGACCSSARASGIMTASLSEEETADVVLERGTTTIGFNTAAWGAIWDYTGFGCPAADFGSFGQFAQFGVSKQSSEWTIDLTGLVSGCNYKVTITYQTSSGSISTEDHNFTADKTTDILTGKVPQVDGITTTFLSYKITCSS